MQDRIAGLIFLIVSASVMVESARLSFGDIRNPGPGFVPFFLGLLMAILSIFLFAVPEPRPGVEDLWKARERAMNILYVFVALMIYLLAFKLIGFFIATFLLMTCLFKIAGEKGYRRGILISLVTMVVLYLFFYKLLNIPFPRGILGV